MRVLMLFVILIQVHCFDDFAPVSEEIELKQMLS